MKREELRQWFVEWLDDYYDELYSEDDLTPEVAESVLTALRPVSREQVENVWRGCEKCNGAEEYSRYAENLTKILLAKYCPHCGRPLTDEAVDMVMERLEALHSETKTD